MSNRLKRVLSKGSLAAITLLSLALAACGSSTTSTGTSGTNENKDIVLATELPVSGGDSAVGVPTQQGVQLAVTQNKDLGNGYTLRWLGKDDVSASLSKHDPQTGAANITALVADPKVVAVVGPFNSGVAAAEMPISNASSLTLISPSNTNPGLTLKDYAADNGLNFNQLHPAGKPSCYFRIPGNDVVQGQLIANIASAGFQNIPGAKTVYVVDDNEVYGQGLATEFLKQFVKNGGKQVGDRASIDAKQAATFPALAQKILAAKPDFVFYGGTSTGGGGALKAAVVAAGGLTVPFAGGDGIADDPDWLKEAGAAAVGTFGTVAAPELGGLSSSTASSFVTAYKAAYNAAPLPYSAMAYDAASIEIKAIKDLIAAGKSVTRENVCGQVAKESITGVTGSISFDANGDNAGAKVFSIWAVGADNKWTFVKNQNI